MSPQTEGHILPVLSQPRAHTKLLQQLELMSWGDFDANVTNP